MASNCDDFQGFISVGSFVSWSAVYNLEADKRSTKDFPKHSRTIINQNKIYSSLAHFLLNFPSKMNLNF